ncbi:MAG: phospholipase D family protein [Verrucomicrobiota bacterium]
MKTNSDLGGTKLAVAVEPQVAAHPGESGLHPFSDGLDALAARLIVADAAERTLDVQYYIWKQDMVGRVLLERLLRAADRGVKVRMLLDDFGTAPSDAVLLAIDSHPNIEVRMFNPITIRSLRALGIVADFRRTNRRMHNKSFTADGQVSIIGGRNIGNEYFEASDGYNHADLDMAAIGPVVNEVAAAFELFWNHRTAVPVSKFSRQPTTPEEFAVKRAGLIEHYTTAVRSEYADTVRGSEFARQFQDGAVTWFWSPAAIENDHPEKVLTCTRKDETHLAPKLRELVHKTESELFLVTPYFVAGKNGLALLAGVRQRGARVVVITNSLASTNSLPVHSGYRRYRRALLEAGVELYEIKPTASSQRQRSGGGWFGSIGSSGSGGSGSSSGWSSLHAKAFAFDRRVGFVGSYNLDPRSNRLNTEMGVIFECPDLAKRLPEEAEKDLAHTAYRVELDGPRLVWVTYDGDKEVRHTSEPACSRLRRFKVRVISCLPIEWML